MLKHVGRPTARPRFIVLRKKRGRSGSRSWPGTPYTLSIASASEIDYPDNLGRMHRPPHPHPIADHRQVNLVFDDTLPYSTLSVVIHTRMVEWASDLESMRSAVAGKSDRVQRPSVQ
ncbi:hypothetical protein KQX54_021585 [Cotesia glomerata]|uniref:Uncharacterized protein n=1 Tax=Cotesia glomerata TaxID=32391 RepID=A0AAV7J8U0_COTGL|nr:hypothetical protein KQX54_021585 [Cotesia glomerata]